MKDKLFVLGAALLAGALAPACIVVDDDDDCYDCYYEPPIDSSFYTTIDADHLLETDLGEGAGMFIEYGVGGRWTLWTSCDSLVTGTLCSWEAHVTARRGIIADVFEFDTEHFDSVSYYSDNSITFYAETDADSDAVEFYTEPGTLLEVRLFLDGYEAPDYLVWFGNGYVHNGAPASPVVFQPDQP